MLEWISCHRCFTEQATEVSRVSIGAYPRTVGTLCSVVLALCLVALCLHSCAQDLPPDPQNEAVLEESFGLVMVSYSEHRVPGGAQPQLLVSGFFARHAGLNHGDVLHVLNQPDLPDPAMLNIRTGHCEIVDQLLGLPPTPNPYDSYIELLDVGPVTFAASGHNHHLRMRSFPGLFENVIGVTYEASLPRALTPTAGSSVAFRAEGGDTVSGFAVTLEAPPVPRLLQIGGEDVLDAYASIDWSSDLEVKWLPSETQATESGPVYLELAVHQFDRTHSLRCVTADTGAAVLPQIGIQAVLDHATSDATVRFIARRIHRDTFTTGGLRSGDAFYVSRDSVVLLPQ